ncbi:HAD hydrolase-like protein [Paenibacillus sp. CC-CFT747]|nr:HAD hydrolase-like protein [Paenibacillus sp. CC-CFT747]
MKNHFSPELKKVIYFDMSHTLVDLKQSFNQAFKETVREYTGRWEGPGADPERMLDVYWEEWKRRSPAGRETAARKGAAVRQARKPVSPPGRRRAKGTAGWDQSSSGLRLACLAAALQGLPVPPGGVFLKAVDAKIRENAELHPRLMPGAREALERLAPRYRLAVISNGSAEKRLSQLQRLGLGRLIPPEHVFTAAASARRKPSPSSSRMR